MTHILDCSLYYSMIGESFNIYDRHTDPNLVKTSALLHIHSQQYELVPAGVCDPLEEAQYDQVTRIHIPHCVKGGPFFTSDTQCIVVNGKNQILRLGGKYRFAIKMYRNRDNPDFFSVLFKAKEFLHLPEWVSF